MEVPGTRTMEVPGGSSGKFRGHVPNSNMISKENKKIAKVTPKSKQPTDFTPKGSAKSFGLDFGVAPMLKFGEIR